MATIRRDEPTRLEGFSDAVFGFSLALPRHMAGMSGMVYMPGFAIDDCRSPG